jgi:metal transporter CNNM
MQSYPIACLLDWLLGHKSGMLYRHAGLKELVALHGESQSGPLSKDEVETLQAVLDLKSKTVCDIMTKIDDVFMLPAASNLNRKTINTILDRGHSRIPIYLQDRQHIIGTLLVKQLLLNDPSHETPIASLKLRKLPKVPYDTPLYEMLHIFEAGSSHMALVVKDADSVSSTAAGDVFITRSPNWSIRKQQTETRKFQPIGIVTLEDVIEEFLGTEV